ncbi:synaptic vesicle glycoprotein 2B isoform X2 [Nilaparvata lugens]|uniref:synaptic vesicle glycoprotein 2B isoform X2 n=1 Tax=Nilaparvata lugens TaxID=108931 RepID=UPI00193DF3C3|nr:synaptic vesicle glycoprotein 2B isoform X2 [Nilaparvata lugens]
MKKEEVYTINPNEQKKDIEDPGENVKFEDALAGTGYGWCNFKITAIGALAIGCSYVGVGAISLILPSAQCDLGMTSIHKGHLISAGFIVVGWSTISGSWQLEILPSFIIRPWRLYYALLGVPSLICAIAMSSLPESPKFLIAKNRGVDALDVLRRVHKENGSRVPGPFKVKSLIWTFEESTHIKSGSSKIGAFLSLMWEQTVPIFKYPYRRDITLICSIQFLLYLCNNGIFLWLPETGNRIAIFVAENGGTPATFCHIVQNYDSPRNKTATYKNGPDSIFGSIIRIDSDIQSHEECKSEVSDRVFITMLVISSCMTLTLVFMSLLMNFVPKKAVLCVSIFAASVVTFLLTFTEGTYILMVEMGAMMMFTGASIPVITNLVVDVFPTNFRAMAVCLTLMSARLGTITANQICGALLDSHCVVILWILIASLIVSTIISFTLPTTKKVTN